jgi:hypothetical protein
VLGVAICYVHFVTKVRCSPQLLPVAVEYVLVQRNDMPVVELLQDVYDTVVSLHSACSASPSIRGSFRRVD